jgi:exonuclease III
MTYYHSTCSHILSKNVNGINFAFDSANNIHLVYANQTDLTIEHEVFNPSTNKFACENEVIASYTLPSNTCSSCTGVATYNGLQTNCMRAGATPSIAIERLSTGDNLVVTFSTPGGGGCSVDSETRFYKSTNLGKNWTYEEVTGCQNSLQPRVAFAHTNGYSTDVAGRFHVMSMYVPSGDNRLAQVDWKSTNSGTSFSGTYMTAVRDTLAPVNTSNCFAGDFNGVAADNANAHFFFNWGELKSGASLWTTEGISNAN